MERHNSISNSRPHRGGDREDGAGGARAGNSSTTQDSGVPSRAYTQQQASGRGLGQWNAFVERGEDRAERRERLQQVPALLRESVERHVRTVYKLQALARELPKKPTARGRQSERVRR